MVEKPQISKEALIEAANVFYNLAQAITAGASSLNSQQISDANMTANAGQMEAAINAWSYGPNGPIQAWINKIKADAQAGVNGQGALATDQANFNTANAVAQAATNAADSLMQQANAQVNTDASNIAALIQLGKTLDTVGFVASLMR